MAFEQEKHNNYEEIQKHLEEDPGQSIRHLAKQIDVAPSTILRRLPGMEESGYLLSEDDKGRLWSFKRKK